MASFRELYTSLSWGGGVHEVKNDAHDVYLGFTDRRACADGTSQSLSVKAGNAPRWIFLVFILKKTRLQKSLPT